MNATGAGMDGPGAGDHAVGAEAVAIPLASRPSSTTKSGSSRRATRSRTAGGLLLGLLVVALRAAGVGALGGVGRVGHCGAGGCSRQWRRSWISPTRRVSAPNFPLYPVYDPVAVRDKLRMADDGFYVRSVEHETALGHARRRGGAVRRRGDGRQHPGERAGDRGGRRRHKKRWQARPPTRWWSPTTFWPGSSARAPDPALRAAGPDRLGRARARPGRLPQRGRRRRDAQPGP